MKSINSLKTFTENNISLISIRMEKSLQKSYPNIAQSFIIGGIVILGVLVFTPVIMYLNNVIGKEAATLTYYLFSMGVPFWIVYNTRKRKAKVGSFNLKIHNPRILPLLLLVSIALVFGIISPLSYLIPMSESIKQSLMETGNQRGIFTFILMVIAAPVLEELIFRGIILDGLIMKYSPMKSILISSLLFGIVHLNPWQFLAGFILGIFIGWIYCKTKSLAYSIIIHSATNLCGYLVRVFSDADSINDTLVEMYGGWIVLIGVTIASGTTICVCILLLRKEFMKDRLKLYEQDRRI